MNAPEHWRLVRLVVENLTPDLLLKTPATTGPLAGHCYVACEALYHLGLREAGWRPVVIHHEGVSHWFLRNDLGEIIDPTAGQFATTVPYHDGRGCGFLTKGPSRRARILMERVSGK